MLLVLAIFVFLVNALNNAPIIGILAQPINDTTSVSYLSSSYVKMVEAGGGQAVPIPFNMPFDKIKFLLDRINGVIFPGGNYLLNLKKTPYYLTEEFIFNYSLEANKKGDYFPIWTECMGFEGLINIVAGKNILDTDIECFDQSLKLIFTDKLKESKIFKAAGVELIDIFANEDVTFNWHYAGLDVTSFPIISDFFNMISTSEYNGKKFVTTIESKLYPIYGIQFHPEKQFIFHSSDKNINHSYNSHIANLYLANFMVNETKKSNHQFDSIDQLNDYLIYNYNPIFAPKTQSPLADFYLQVYLFD